MYKEVNNMPKQDEALEPKKKAEKTESLEDSKKIDL